MLPVNMVTEQPHGPTTCRHAMTTLSQRSMHASSREEMPYMFLVSLQELLFCARLLQYVKNTQTIVLCMNMIESYSSTTFVPELGWFKSHTEGATKDFRGN